MAYVVKLWKKCNESYCQKEATYEVRDKWNGSVGQFCATLANRIVAAGIKAPAQLPYGSTFLALHALYSAEWARRGIPRIP